MRGACTSPMHVSMCCHQEFYITGNKVTPTPDVSPVEFNIGKYGMGGRGGIDGVGVSNNYYGWRQYNTACACCSGN